MAYATSTDLETRFGEAEMIQLTDTTGTGVVDTARLALELESASGQMDVYLGARHALPLSDITQGQTNDLTRICCDIARYRLWNDAASDEVRLRYQDAIKTLEMIAKGTLPLLTNSQAGSPTSGTYVGTMTRNITDADWAAFNPL